MPTKAPEKPDQDRYNPGDLHAAEQFPNAYTGNGLDQREKYANDPENRTKNSPEDTPTSNIDAAKEQEQNPMNYTGTSGKGDKRAVKGFWRRYAPTAIFGGGTISLVAIAGSLGLNLAPFDILSKYTNDTNDANRSVLDKRISSFGEKLGGNANEKNTTCSGGPKLPCEFVSISEKEADVYKKQGFTFGDETKTSSGRIVFTSITFPADSGGATVNSLSGFRDAVNNQPSLMKRFTDVYNPTRSIFFSEHFRNVLSKLGLTKLKKISGETHDEAQASYKNAIESGPSVDTEARVEKRDPNEAADDAERQEIELTNAEGDQTVTAINEAVQSGNKIQSLDIGASGNPASRVAGMACLSYNVGSLISTGAFGIKSARYVVFAAAILTGISAMIVNESTAAETAVVLGILFPSTFPEKVEDPNTGQMIDNPNKGKNATDSEAYRAVAYGDKVNFSDLARRYFLSGGIIGALQTAINWINENIGRDTVRTGCKLTNNIIVDVISFLAAPVLSAAILGIMQILPVEEWAASIVNNILEAAAGADITTDITGVDAGNILFFGTGLIMGQSAQHFGQKPGDLQAVRANMLANQEVYDRELAWRQAEASPFDMTNQYSFANQLVAKLQQYTSYEGSVAAFANNLFSMVPGSLKTLSTTASASFNQPVSPFTDERFNQCKDPYYEELGVVGDMGCVPRFVPTEEPVKQSQALSYMREHDQINLDTGEAKQNTEYAKWIKYCDEREERWGASSVPLEDQDDGVDWYTGAECLKDTKNNQMFSEFVGYKITNDTANEVVKLIPDSADIAYDSIGEALAAAIAYHTTNTFVAATGEVYAR